MFVPRLLPARILVDEGLHSDGDERDYVLVAVTIKVSVRRNVCVKV